ncbi:hypothetical protein [Pseudomonas sp. PLMAX]|jgi:hypothetical protein|uniref:hypothetical protein n=1 Tax=Pseudomonas sp. PLMAX TaxID=2201998 RepID=UPI0038BA3F4C
MHSFDESFLALKGNCEASTSFMLVKALEANALSLKALGAFDQISDYPADLVLDPDAREKLVAELLSKSLNLVADQGEAQ